MKPDAWTTLDYTFTPNIHVDTADEAETAAKLSGITSKKTQLNVISIVKDVDAELEQIEKEQDESGYKTDYPTERVSEE
jgi:SPP1 family phage portal protein